MGQRKIPVSLHFNAEIFCFVLHKKIKYILKNRAGRGEATYSLRPIVILNLIWKTNENKNQNVKTTELTKRTCTHNLYPSVFNKILFNIKINQPISQNQVTKSKIISNTGPTATTPWPITKKQTEIESVILIFIIILKCLRINLTKKLKRHSVYLGDEIQHATVNNESYKIPNTIQPGPQFCVVFQFKSTI